ncbi:DNA-binding protein [Rhodopirellula europaea]|uniref:helix-turn-helix domain-containing transcriptional regulator n=1 Tax=Rhodopirellula europaea TaxID=1263866 RepID=UPI003D2B946D
MALTKDFKERIKSRADADPDFRRALIVEAIESMLAGDVDIGKSLLRDYVNATVGFPALAEGLGGDRDPKSLMRMLSDRGNPRMQNFFEIVKFCQQHEGITLQLSQTAVQTPPQHGMA